jgi:hypothetical protein
MTTTDQGTGGACAPAACAATQIRKVNVMLTRAVANAVNKNLRVFRNSLQSQISLRGMAFVTSTGRRSDRGNSSQRNGKHGGFGTESTMRITARRSDEQGVALVTALLAVLLASA